MYDCLESGVHLFSVYADDAVGLANVYGGRRHAVIRKSHVFWRPTSTDTDTDAAIVLLLSKIAENKQS